MERDFFELYLRNDLMALEVGHNSVADWNVIVYDRRNKVATGGWGPPVVYSQATDRKLAFADAYQKLAEYYSEKFGGY